MKSLVIPFSKPRVSRAEGGQERTGVRTEQFEREFASYFRHQHAVAVNSHTAALQLALRAIGLKAGQGVLVPTLSLAGLAEAVRYFDACPILVDCHPEDFNLDVADAEIRLQQAAARGIQVVAILPVHFAGQIGDVAGVRRLARKYHLLIVEETGSGWPAFYRENVTENWKTVGTSADISCYSFPTDQPITVAGEGGVACTNRTDYAQQLRTISWKEISRETWKRFSAEGNWVYEIMEPGSDYRLSKDAAAVGIQQIRLADKLQMERTSVAQHYEHLLSEVEELRLPGVHPDRIHSWDLYVVRLHLGALSITRTEVIRKLKAAGITTQVHYPPLHLHPYYQEKFGYAREDLPCAAQVSREALSLPNFPGITQKEIEYVAHHLQQIVVEHSKNVHFSTLQAAGEPGP